MPDRLEEHVLVLASASEARASLLRHAGVELRLCPSDVDEDPLKDRLAALGYGGRLVARRLAEEKALEVSARIKDALVLGGDQTLVLGSRLFSKAASRLEAYEALNALSGRDHTLHAAYAFARRGRLIASGLESAKLRMRSVGPEEIANYLDAATAAVHRSVGCYQVEALGRGLFEEIDGDHSTILGLPLTPVLGFLRRWRRQQGAVSC